MTDIRWVTPDFAVAGQLEPADFSRLAAEGFKTVVKNRPDGEEPGQPSEADMNAAASAAGLVFKALPFAGAPPPPMVSAFASMLAKSEGPVLAYCRTGRRSIMAWALAQAFTGARRPDEIIAAAAKAGYELSDTRGALEALAPKS